MDFNRIASGMIRAARLDRDFYEEIEHDPSYNRDALIVVIIAAVASGVGTFINGVLFVRGGIFLSLVGLVVSVGVAILAYYLWTFLAHFFGTRFFKGSGDRDEVQRALGFAYAPQALNFLAFIPCLGSLIGLVAWVWSIAAGFVAVRQSLDMDDGNAILTVLVSGISTALVMGLVGIVLGGLGLGVASLGGALK
jgi:hypothetical protein